MTEETSLETLRRRHDAIREALDAAEQEALPGGRERVRGDILALYKETERLQARLEEFKEGIRPLVERYKSVFRTPDEARSPAPAPIRVDHLGASTYVERGWNAIAGADYERGVRELKRALELAPGQARAETLLAWALMRQDQLPAAIRLLEGVLDREPDNALALTCLGYARSREERFPEAVALLTRVLREDSDRTAVLYANLYLGTAYAQEGRYWEASTFLERALALGPKLAEAYWELGWCQYHAGERALALETWQRGADANRFNPWGERCLEAVDRMRRSGEEASA